MKRLITLLMTVSMVFSLVACNSSNTTASSAASTQESNSTGDSKPVTVGVILKTLNSPYWQCMVAGIHQAEKDLGVKVLLNGPPSETSYNEQLNEIQTVLSSSDAQALVLAPLQPDMAANAVKNATIPILAVDTTFKSDNLKSYIGISNEDAAKAGGAYVVQKLSKGCRVAILGGVQGDSTSEDRIKGWKEGVEEAGGKVVSMQYTDATTDKAVSTMENIIQTLPDGIDAVVCHSDDVALGATNAVKQNGLSDKIKVFGFGGISGGQPVKDGKFAATIDIGPYQMGYDAVKTAVAAVKGEQVQSVIDMPATVIDSTNVDEYLTKLKTWTGK